ncbi:MAG: hypothetical protein ACYCSN_19105 [Acidobacteriaceae bacterium]
MPSVKLSELPDDTPLVVTDVGLYAAGDLRRMITEGSESTECEVYVAVPTKWTPNAQTMLDDYLEDASAEMYDGFDERLRDCLTSEVVIGIQAILDAAIGVIPYYDCGDEVEIDVVPCVGDPEWRELHARFVTMAMERGAGMLLMGADNMTKARLRDMLHVLEWHIKLHQGGQEGASL